MGNEKVGRARRRTLKGDLSRREFLRLAGAGITAVPSFLAACGGDTQQQGNAANVQSVEGKLTFWYWGETDAPGANDWMEENVEAYKEEKPHLEINVVPQALDTLISSFQAAVSARQGPDIASQWATGPVLTQVWQNAVVPISDYLPQSETDQWLNTYENTYIWSSRPSRAARSTSTASSCRPSDPRWRVSGRP